MRNAYFIFGGYDCRTNNVMISGSGSFGSPVRAYESIQVPGRSGDILMPEKRLENTQVTYPAFIMRDFENNFAALKGELLSRIGYQRLEDSYHPDEFRLAYYAGAVSPTMQRNLRSGEFKIVFDCKPQRFLKEGEFPFAFTADGEIANPTHFAGKPLIRVEGAGELTIGDITLTITASQYSTYIDIDCETCEAYGTGLNLNANVSSDSIDFPSLKAGITGVELGTGITKVQITPRWYRL